MKQKLTPLYLKILSGLMALLGFAACSDKAAEYGVIVAEYGTLGAEYKVVGTVVSKGDTEKAIKDIEVIFVKAQSTNDDDSVILFGDTTYTDKNGKFEIDTNAMQTRSIKIRFNDIDGDENGRFENKAETIEFKDSDFDGADGWNTLPKVEKDMGTVELTPKSETSEE